MKVYLYFTQTLLCPQAFSLFCGAFLSSQADQLKDAVIHQDDSDLEKKRRETEALLQSMGITSEVPVGRFYLTSHFADSYKNVCFIHHLFDSGYCYFLFIIDFFYLASAFNF